MDHSSATLATTLNNPLPSAETRRIRWCNLFRIDQRPLEDYTDDSSEWNSKDVTWTTTDGGQWIEPQFLHSERGQLTPWRILQIHLEDH